MENGLVQQAVSCGRLQRRAAPGASAPRRMEGVAMRPARKLQAAQRRQQPRGSRGSSPGKIGQTIDRGEIALPYLVRANAWMRCIAAEQCAQKCRLPKTMGINDCCDRITVFAQRFAEKEDLWYTCVEVCFTIRNNVRRS